MVKSWDFMDSVSNDLFGHFNLDTKYLENALLKKNVSIKVVGPNKTLDPKSKYLSESLSNPTTFT